MPRLRKVVVKRASSAVAGEVPHEFLDVEDRAWSSEKHTRRFMRDHDLVIDAWATTNPQSLKYGPLSRYRTAAEAWSLAHGLGERTKWNYWHTDWAALRDAGFTDDVFTPRKERMRYVCLEYGSGAPAS